MEHVYIIGHPLAHSKSPVMCNAVYEHLGLSWHYDMKDIESADKADAFLRKEDYLALNATMPYKPNAYAAATVRAASARLAGGANLLVSVNESRIAYNTDGQGCVRYLQHKGVSFKNALVAVCGTGPTSLAILHAAAMAGAQRVLLLSRNTPNAHQVLDGYLDRFKTLANATLDVSKGTAQERGFSQTLQDTTFQFGSYSTSTQALAASDIIIDATPLGMNAGDPSPLDASLLSGNQVVCDVVYGHGTTQLMADAAAAGCKMFDGAGMLVAQAVLNTQTIMDVHHVKTECLWEDMFSIMARAAQFEC